MPRGDRTGPEGMGPMTGRRKGYCSDYDSPEFSRGRVGGRCGRGFGDFRGNRGFAAPGIGRRGGYGFAVRDADPQSTSAQRSEYLEAEITALQQELKAMEAHLSELKQED